MRLFNTPTLTDPRWVTQAQQHIYLVDGRMIDRDKRTRKRRLTRGYFVRSKYHVEPTV